MNNVISYATPAFGGFSVHAMYSNSGTGNTSNDLDKWSKNGHYYGIGTWKDAWVSASKTPFDILKISKNIMAMEVRMIKK